MLNFSVTGGAGNVDLVISNPQEIHDYLVSCPTANGGITQFTATAGGIVSMGFSPGTHYITVSSRNAAGSVLDSGTKKVVVT